jgi:hypothetical protein
VIFVTGKVAISGTLRGQVTLAATDNIIIADDVKYATDLGWAMCASPSRDMLGVFSGTDVDRRQRSNNPLTGRRRGSVRFPGRDPGVLLALSNSHLRPGHQDRRACGTSSWGRLYLPHGWRHSAAARAVGTGGGTGNMKRYCTTRAPRPIPAVFPDDRSLCGGHYYEIEPTGFNIATYWPAGSESLTR